MASTPKTLAIAPDLLGMMTAEPKPAAVPPEAAGPVPVLETGSLMPFPEHRFKPLEGEAFLALVESVRQLGVLHPVIVWKKADGHTILSGHNRVRAAKEAGLNEIPVIIKENLTNDEAVLIVTETNLRHRSFADMTHSERALCLKQHYGAVKSQGKRSDLIKEIKTLLDADKTRDGETFRQVGEKLHTDEKTAEDYGLSARNVSRYIRIAGLVQPLLDRLDRGEIPFMAAHTLSFIEDTALQKAVEVCMRATGNRIDIKKAGLLRQYYDEHRLVPGEIEKILAGEKTHRPKGPSASKPIRIKPAVISRYFTNGESQKEIMETVEKALETYFARDDD